MRTRMACAAVAAALTLATIAPAQAAEYQPTSVLPGFTATLDAPLPRGEAWFEATSNPDWAMVGPDGTIRLAPGEDVTPGTYEWPVQATFQDNHTETYPVRVTVGQEQTADASQEGAVIDAFVQYAPEVTKQCSATALGVGLPDLDHGVRDRIAVAVVDGAEQAHRVRAARGDQLVAVAPRQVDLLVAVRVAEERADGQAHAELQDGAADHRQEHRCLSLDYPEESGRIPCSR